MQPSSAILDRVLVLEMVRVTEAAAMAAATMIGRGDEKAADAAAVEAMRRFERTANGRNRGDR
jgi:fructose-1,6-bisphosphatase II / sedoheptulose-1,7-bisphosphatase